MTQSSQAAPPPPPPPPPSSPPPPPPPPPPSVVREPAPARALSPLAARFQDTPGRMRLISAALVVVGLLVGLLAAQSFWAVDGALQRAGENAAQLVRLQDIQTRLVRADADATNAFLVGGLEPTEQRRDYDEALARASEQVAFAARAQPADGEALAALNGSIQDYAATVQVARANNRQALPVGAQYLRNASASLRAAALPLLDSLGEANRARAEAEFAAARRNWIGAVVACVVGLGVVAAASVWLARRTHRYISVPVVGSAVVILLVLVASAVVLGSVAGTVGAVRAGSYASARALSDARIAAFDAKANESLTLISRGSGAAFEEAWVASAETTADRLADAVTTGGASTDLETRWTAYADQHRQIRELDDGGQWEQAVAAATSGEDGSVNAAFDAFDAASAQRLTEASESAATELRDAGSWLAVGGWLCVLAGLLAAVLGWWGLWQRIEEYR
jgi:hypothetical protein